MLGWAFGASVYAGESGFGVGLSLAHDSNIARVETGPQSEWTRALILGLFYRENTADVSARVLAQVERRHFYHHVFRDDTGGFLDGAVVWTISPRRLTWVSEDTYREIQLNITEPGTPANLTKANSLSTGPDFTFPFSSTNSAVIGGRYGRLDVQNSNVDNRRYTAYVRGVHALSSQAKLSLNYEATRTYFEPEAQAFAKVLREDWFARYENRSPINTTALDVGVSRVTQYGGDGPQDSRLARFSSSQRLSSQSTVRAALTDQVSDTYTDLLAGVTSPTAPRETPVVVFNGSNLATGDLYHSRRGELEYANDDGRFAYTLQGYARNVDFETLDQDYHEKGGTFLWSWTYSSDLRFNASTAYAKRTFPSMSREDTDRGSGASGSYRVNGRVTVALSAGRFARQSTAPNSSYADNQIMMILSYSTGFTDVQSRR